MSQAYTIQSFVDVLNSSTCGGKNLVTNEQMAIDVFHLIKSGDSIHIWFKEQDIINNSQTHLLVIEGKIDVRFPTCREELGPGQILSIYNQQNVQIVALEPSKLMQIHNQVEGITDDNYSEIVSTILKMETREPYTVGHNRRVGLYTVQILNFLHPETNHVEAHLAAQFHDVGKIRLDSEILNKPGKLTAEEFEHIKQHPLHSYEILLEQTGIKNVAEWARWHHERLDGSGYPDGLKGDWIPLESRVMAVADVFDALTTPRCYRKKMSFDDAVSLMKKDVAEGKLDADAFTALVALIGNGAIMEGKDDQGRPGEFE